VLDKNRIYALLAFARRVKRKEEGEKERERARARKSTLSLAMERSFPFSIADKTRASLVENLGLSIKSRLTPDVACRFCIERMIEYRAPKGRPRQSTTTATPATTINRWWRLSVTARSTRLFQFIFK